MVKVLNGLEFIVLTSKKDDIDIHVINFKEASGRFFFHFLEVFKKCLEYIRIFFIHFLEISKFW